VAFPTFLPGCQNPVLPTSRFPYFVPYEVLHLPESRNVGYISSHHCRRVAVFFPEILIACRTLRTASPAGIPSPDRPFPPKFV
jgi:hypothetical protein